MPSNVNGDDLKDVSAKVCLDLFLLILVALPIPVLEYAVEPYRRGFFCDDESIDHTLKESTIPTVVVAVVGTGVPVITMILTEIYLYRLRSRKCSMEGHYRRTNYYLCGKLVHPYLASLYQVMGAYLFGLAVCQTTTDIMKYSLGRLRPNFLEICKPDWSNIRCYMDRNPDLMRYVEEDVCTETDYFKLKEARLSHPSGHASSISYFMVFLGLYVQSRLTWKGSKLLKHFFMAVCFFAALYTCLSRISDYMHHPADVVVGALLGTGIALFTVFYISHLFKAPRLRDIARKVTELQTFYQRAEEYPGGTLSRQSTGPSRSA